MMNIYRLNKLGYEELEKVTGGSFTSIIRSIGCYMGMCDGNNCALIGLKLSLDKSTRYEKLRCLNCGRMHYHRIDLIYNEKGESSGCWTYSSEAEYNAAVGTDLLTI